MANAAGCYIQMHTDAFIIYVISILYTMDMEEFIRCLKTHGNVVIPFITFEWTHSVWC